jgi:hypothetical protein
MAKPHKINFDEPALRALDAQKLRNFRLLKQTIKNWIASSLSLLNRSIAVLLDYW